MSGKACLKCPEQPHKEGDLSLSLMMRLAIRHDRFATPEDRHVVANLEKVPKSPLFK